MKYFLCCIAYLPSSCAMVGAGFLAFHSKEGWGYFIFAAVLLCPSFRWGKGDSDDDDDETPTPPKRSPHFSN